MILCLTNATDTLCLAAPVRCDEHTYLTIGTLNNSTDYTVYIYNESQDKLISFNQTSTNTGELTIDIQSRAGFFNQVSVYYLWVTAEGADLNAREDITIGTETYTMFRLYFERVSTGITNQTITPDA